MPEWNNKENTLQKIESKAVFCDTKYCKEFSEIGFLALFNGLIAEGERVDCRNAVPSLSTRHAKFAL